MSHKLLNKRVVITLKTGIGIEGIPTQWDDERVFVTYPDNDNYTIIFNPSENIMMVSVFAEPDEYIGPSPEQNDRIVEPPEPELDHFEPDPQLRACKLADLHIQKKEAIREQLHHHFKNNRVATPRAPTYDTPNFQK